MAFEKELMEGVYFLKGSLPSGVDVSSVILASEGEALFFDSLYYPKDTLRMIEIAETEELDPIGLVNTHWHVDHTAGNGHFNLRTLSHDKCVQLMKSDLPAQLENAKAKIGEVQVKYPDWTFQDRLELRIGEKGLSLMHLPGHTPDSIVGLVERDHLLIAGDTVMELPFVTYGNSTDLLTTLRTIEKLDVNLILQGHGSPCGKEKIQGDIEYLEKLRKVVAEQHDGEKGVETVKSLPIGEFLPRERAEKMSVIFTDRIHKMNIDKISKEMRGTA